MLGLGFRSGVQGLGSRVSVLGVGFVVQGLERHGLGFKVCWLRVSLGDYGSGFRVQG